MAAEYFAREEVRVSAEGVEWLAVPGWRDLDWLWHGFSTRRGGVSRVYLPEGSEFEAGMQAGELNLGFTAADDAACVRENSARCGWLGRLQEAERRT